jgi:hypothetical protein
MSPADRARFLATVTADYYEQQALALIEEAQSTRYSTQRPHLYAQAQIHATLAVKRAIEENASPPSPPPDPRAQEALGPQ